MDEQLLLRIQEDLAKQFGIKVDIYRHEGKGILAVPHGAPLTPANVIFVMQEEFYF